MDSNKPKESRTIMLRNNYVFLFDDFQPRRNDPTIAFCETRSKRVLVYKGRKFSPPPPHHRRDRRLSNAPVPTLTLQKARSCFIF